jgi:hydrogenase nickel incorporation protein HypA/HybF
LFAATSFQELQMHEMGIANSILEAVRVEAARYPGSRPAKVGVRLGELAAIDPDSLRFCFDALIAETDLALLVLEIEQTQRTHRCHRCGTDFVVSQYSFVCPSCRAFSEDCIAGDELELRYVEVEEDEPVAVGAQNP